MGDKNIYYRNWVGMVYASFKKPGNAMGRKKKRKQNFEDEKYIFNIIILVFHRDAGIVGILAFEEA